MGEDKVILKINGFAKGAPTHVTVLRDWGDIIFEKNDVEETLEIELPSELIGKNVKIHCISHAAKPYLREDIRVDSLGMTHTIQFSTDLVDQYNDPESLRTLDFNRKNTEGQFANRLHNRGRRFDNKKFSWVFYFISILFTLSGLYIHSISTIIGGLFLIILSWQMTPYLSGDKKIGKK